ncbi:MAG: restriction endonuclease subunit S [Puniceicoccaceae bacterium]|nr:MAG: restriction endonuclease subunit S [Puniceicoccaceae bacterium]
MGTEGRGGMKSSDLRRLALGDIAKISSGGTPSRSVPEYWNGEVPWVKTAQIQNCKITSGKIDEWITAAGLKGSSAKMIAAGTVLMAMYGQGKTRGQVAILEIDASINQACAAIELSEEANRDYVFQYLLFSYDRIRQMSNTGGQENLSAALIKEIPILLPPLPEQKAIADLLATWDAAIEKTERLIEAKERRFRGLMQELIGDVCHQWKHFRPDAIFDTVSEKNFPEEELLSVTQDRGVIPRSMLEGRVMSPDGSTSGYKRIKRGDFAISLRSFQGGIEYSDYQGILSPAYTVLRPKIAMSEDYWRLFFKSYIFIKRYLDLAVIGIRDGKQISIPDFMSVKIPVPSVQDQCRIAETVSYVQREIGLLKGILEQYKKQKRGLMQKLLTGEWRVDAKNNESKERAKNGKK